jgi:hypothetical protein
MTFGEDHPVEGVDVERPEPVWRPGWRFDAGQQAEIADDHQSLDVMLNSRTSSTRSR